MPHIVYYTTNIKNAQNMIELGILSHAQLLQHATISAQYPSKLVAARQNRQVQGKSLWCFVNCQIACKNPKLYHYVHLYGAANVAVLVIELPQQQDASNWMLAQGDACMEETTIVPFDTCLFEQMKQDVDDDNWTQHNDTHRKAMAEVLIADLVPSSWIKHVLVHTESKLLQNTLPQICKPEMFFDYSQRIMPVPFSIAKLLHNTSKKIVIQSDNLQATYQQMVQQEATTEHAKLYDLPQMHCKTIAIVPFNDDCSKYCQDDGTLVLR